MSPYAISEQNNLDCSKAKIRGKQEKKNNNSICIDIVEVKLHDIVVNLH